MPLRASRSPFTKSPPHSIPPLSWLGARLLPHGRLERAEQMRDAVRVVAHQLAAAAAARRTRRPIRPARAASAASATRDRTSPRCRPRGERPAPLSSTSASRISSMRSSSTARGMKSRSKLWIAAHASGTGVTGMSAPMRAITPSHSVCTRASRSGSRQRRTGRRSRRTIGERHRRADGHRRAAVSLPPARDEPRQRSTRCIASPRRAAPARRARAPFARRQLAQQRPVLEHAVVVDRHRTMIDARRVRRVARDAEHVVEQPDLRRRSRPSRVSPPSRKIPCVTPSRVISCT